MAILPHSELQATQNYNVDIGNPGMNSQTISVGNCHRLTNSRDCHAHGLKYIYNSLGVRCE